MKETRSTDLPVPKWCFILLGIPTFFMPLAYLAVALWAFTAQVSLDGEIRDPWEWMMKPVQIALYVTYAMGVLYIGWAIFSKQLSLKEKVMWVFIIVFTNMLGMPIFFAFMIRRYLGLEGVTNKRDEAELENFLEKNEISRDHLTAEQMNILHPFCRRQRLLRLWCIPQLLTAIFLIYLATVSLPNVCFRIFTDSGPIRLVLVDNEKNAREETLLSPEDLQNYVLTIFMFGTIAGGMAVLGFGSAASAIYYLLSVGDKKALIDLLRAS